MPTNGSNELFTALQKAQEDLKGIEKTDWSQHDRRRFVSHETMIRGCKKALLDNDLSFTIDASVYTPLNGAPNDGWSSGTLHVSATVRHKAGGMIQLARQVPVCPHKAMKPDKAAMATESYVLIYLLRGLLMIPRVEPGELDERPDKAMAPADDRTEAVAMWKLWKTVREHIDEGSLAEITGHKESPANQVELMRWLEEAETYYQREEIQWPRG